MHSSRTRKDSTGACVVCCEEIDYFAIGQCDHPICYVCCVRMRVLGKENYCAVCRADLDKVILTNNSGKWASIQDQLTRGYMDKRLGLCYTNKDIRTKVKELLEHKCMICPNRPSESHFDSLREHTRREHQVFYCTICVAHHCKFSKEWKLYNKSELATHRRVGDANDKSHKGHPLCQFCEERYLDDDELHRHLRKNHFWCHICEKDGKQLYYRDYPSLRDHFKDDHYVCEEDMCKYEQFTSVFRSDIDLQAHRASKHHQKMSKAQIRQARQVDVDVVYNQRPGNKGRAITGQDYDEVRTNDQRPKRSKGHGKGNSNSNRQEEVNLKTAIDNSLATPQVTSRTPSPPATSTPTETAKEENVELQINHNDFPTLTGATGNLEISPTVAKKSYRNKATIDSLKDFPNLGSKVQPKKPPPGFGAVVKKTTKSPEGKPSPPGLSLNKNKQSPPINNKSDPPNPPKTIESNNSSMVSRTNSALSDGNSKCLPKKDPVLANKNTVSRNQAFIEHVKMQLGHDLEKFARFKTLSGKFRQGHCSAKDYYMDCTSLFGQNFAFIFNELVDLLPDSDKRLELLSVHSDAKALVKQNGQTMPQSNRIRRASPQIAWGPPPPPANQTKPAKQPEVKQDSKSKREIDFPSLPAAEPRQMKPINIYRPSQSQPMKSAWVRGK